MSENFAIGDIVETARGAQFWGRIIAFDNDEAMPGCTVLAIAPGFEGSKHVYPLKQLRLRASGEKASVELGKMREAAPELNDGWQAEADAQVDAPSCAQAQDNDRRGF